MEKCNKCGVDLVGNLLMKHGGRKRRNGEQAYRKTCRTCWNAKIRKYWRNRDGLWWVYLLEKEHYVGETHSWRKRYLNHRKDGRYADDMKVLHRCDTEEEALRIEAEYHAKGYKGKHTNSRKS